MESQVDVVYLDFAKAFDKADIDITRDSGCVFHSFTSPFQHHKTLQMSLKQGQG